MQMSTTSPRRTADPDTSERILDVAERLVQTRGFNGFSYADIAAELDVTKAALHYHFRNKADLGEALVVRYSEHFGRSLDEADGALPDAATRLAAFAELYVDVIRRGRMCLCGMLAAEYRTLPVQMQQAVVAFFDRIETWLAGVLELGRCDRTLHFEGEPIETARYVVSELEGAMLLARLHDDVEQFEVAVRRVQHEFGAQGT
jgi:TetR/AcrR family transcriptional regulator, transcriptional repressor for nem operon